MIMVRRRMKQLSNGHLNLTRIATLRFYNLERGPVWCVADPSLGGILRCSETLFVALDVRLWELISIGPYPSRLFVTG